MDQLNINTILNRELQEKQLCNILNKFEKENILCKQDVVYIYMGVLVQEKRIL